MRQMTGTYTLTRIKPDGTSNTLTAKTKINTESKQQVTSIVFDSPVTIKNGESLGLTYTLGFS